uniref:Uncharacterized protein n=1 Tax=viral metagenome TaxID=1070528 RepID=A0A6H1ZCL8_9ZZZZ
MKEEIKRPHRKRFGYKDEHYDLVMEKEGKSRKKLVEEVGDKIRLDFPSLLILDNTDRLKLLGLSESTTELVLNYVFMKSYF